VPAVSTAGVAVVDSISERFHSDVFEDHEVAGFVAESFACSFGGVAFGDKSVQPQVSSD
jgi:hypothetical protein